MGILFAKQGRCMNLGQAPLMRMEMGQRQLLTPRMIQSMEILQLPLALLEERIEQELQSNPVLEMNEGESEAEVIADAADGQAERAEGEEVLVVKDNSDHADDFDRLERISEYLENEDFFSNSSPGLRQSSYDGERDRKLDAMNNTAARGVTLQEHLLGQWAFVECSPEVRKAGEAIINYIDPEGYFRAEFELVIKESKQPLTIPQLTEALRLVQTLEPPGIGARTLRECLLLQLAALEQDPERAAG